MLGTNQINWDQFIVAIILTDRGKKYLKNITGIGFGLERGQGVHQYASICLLVCQKETKNI